MTEFTQILWLYYIYLRRRFKRILIKTPADLSYIQKVKEFRFMFWNMLVIDACLYCTREMLHHKLFIFPEENFFSLFSYVIASLGLFFSLLELGMVIRYIYRIFFRIDSYVLSDLLSVEGVNKLLCQYEV